MEPPRWEYEDLKRPRRLIPLSELQLDIHRPGAKHMAEKWFEIPKDLASFIQWESKDAFAKASAINFQARPVCGAGVDVDTFVRDLHTGQAMTVFKQAADEPLNIALFRDLSCLLQSVANRPPKTTRSAKIANGANGVVARGILSTELNALLFPEDEPPAFIVKTALKTSADEDTLNELVVGLGLTNRLREMIPQFMYVYGGYLCAPSRIVDGALETCSSSGAKPVHYNMIETIDNCDLLFSHGTLKDWITASASSPDFLNDLISVLMQVILTLCVAQRLPGGFSHDDLHDGNVIVREFRTGDRTLLFPVPDRAPVYLRTRFLTTLLDLGRATGTLTISTEGQPRLKKYGEEVSIPLGGAGWPIGQIPGRVSVFADVLRVVTSAVVRARIVHRPSLGLTKNLFRPLLSLPDDENVLDQFIRTQLGPWMENYSWAPFNVEVDPFEYVLAINAFLVNAFGLVDGPTIDAPLLAAAGPAPEPVEDDTAMG